MAEAMIKPRPFGHYFILEKIAQGGMAEIFKGLTYDFSGLKKFIVIKRILPHIAANQDFIGMLIDEAKIAVRLNHGNVAQTFDLGKVAEDYFIVMEFVEGRTLSQFFKKSVVLKKSIPISMVSYMVGEICNGLDYIHRRQDDNGQHLGIVHCDISPQNIIVSESGTVKIVDFGVAKAAFKLSEKERGVLKGKFAYMSPEQTDGFHVEANSDIFSTGVVLWELLTGRRLFKKKNNSDTIEAVKTMTVYPPSAYRNEIPSELDEIVMKCLERDPRKRFQNSSDVSLALTKFNLKHYPDFKPSRIGEFMKGIFEDEENTGDIFNEKTQLEELTVLDENNKREEDDESTPAEDTLIVDPQELDFHSIFEEIDVDDVSEITRTIGLGKGENPESISQGVGPAEDEITGDVPGEHGEIVHAISDVLDEIPPPTKPAKDFKRQAMVAGFGIFIAIILFMIAHMMFSNRPTALEISVIPADARVYFNGEPLIGDGVFNLGDLKPRTHYRIRAEREGYQTIEEDVFLFPSWSKSVELHLKKGTFGIIEIDSIPTGAAVYIDGQMTGKKTPAVLDSSKLSFPVVLGLSLGGAPTWKQEVSHAPPKPLKIQANLDKPFGILEIQSQPPGASVILSGSEIGKTPILSTQVPAEKPLILQMKLDGYRPYEKKVFLKNGQKGRISPTLQKIPSR